MQTQYCYVDWARVGGGLADKAHLSVSHVIAPCWLTRQSERYAELAARSLPLHYSALYYDCFMDDRLVSFYLVIIYSFSWLYLYNSNIPGGLAVLGNSNQIHSPMLHKTFRKFLFVHTKIDFVQTTDMNLNLKVVLEVLSFWGFS